MANVVDNAPVTFELRAADNALIGSFSSKETALVIAHDLLRRSDSIRDSVLLQKLSHDQEVIGEALLVLRDGASGPTTST